MLAAITAAAREHQARLIKSKTRPGVALPATQRAADQAAEQGYADTIRRPAAAVENFDDGSWSLPGGSLVIVDDADHLDPTLCKRWSSRPPHGQRQTAAHHQPRRLDHATDRGNAVTALQEHLPRA